MPARDHFRAHARRRVELAATLRVHDGPAKPPSLVLVEQTPPQPELRVIPEAPAKSGPRMTLEWTGEGPKGATLEVLTKGEAYAAKAAPPKVEASRAALSVPRAEAREAPLQAVRIRDLGLGGAGIEIPEASERERAAAAPLDREVQVTIELFAPTLWDPLILNGKIAWVRRGGAGRGTRAGVRFEHREPAALYALFRLLGV